ncbi:hypothetical protein J8V44_21000 [Photorhabdus bodei]|nr:hypothetical protein [Photorhabdus bodei]
MASLKFAHLLGLKKSASEDDDDKEKSKKAKSRRAEEEDRDEEDAEDDEDDTQAEEDDTDAEEDDDDKDTSSKKGKKAKSRRAEEDDDDENAEDDDDDKKEGRRAERKRCAAIFGSKHAANRPDMAAHLAFNTRMSSREAISTLAAIGSVSAPRRASLDERMQQAQQVRLGPDARQHASGSVEALVANATRLYNSAKGKK